MSKNTAIARAFGRRDWRKVIELETKALAGEEHKQYSYAMIGMAYENLSEYESAKENYAKALDIDQCLQQSLEGLSRVYYKEQNYDNAYYYVQKGLYSAEEIDFSIPKFLKILVAVILKIMRPSRPFDEIRRETNNMDQSRNKWKKWALEFKEWYEKNSQINQNGEKSKLH